MKQGSASREPTPRRRRVWFAAGIIVTLALLAGALWWASYHPGQNEGTRAAGAATRFSSGHRATMEELATLRWEEVGQLAGAIGADPAELARVTQLAEAAGTPPAIYLRAMLLIVQNKPEQALSAFNALNPQTIPGDLLYAPYRLAEELRPDSPNRYLPALREAVDADRVAPLIKARVQARDGRLTAALGNYLRTDPASWTRYDLKSMQRIAIHQGLAGDLAALAAGALSSGRVDPRLAPALQGMARQQPREEEVEAFKQQLRRALEEQTPEGKLALESAKRLLKDRQMFLSQDYAGLIGAHRDAEAPTLSTETVLLLFLSAVELKERMEIDRWGQELKRRHREAEVREWVDETSAVVQ